MHREVDDHCSESDRPVCGPITPGAVRVAREARAVIHVTEPAAMLHT